jgi:hypothetical protein
MGGGGNQLFQYATGRALAERNNRRLMLDISHYQSDNNSYRRKFGLNEFLVSYHKCWTPQELSFLYFDPNECSSIGKWISNNFVRNQVKLLVENGFEYSCIDRNIRHQHLVLDGYWQSEKDFCGD